MRALRAKGFLLAVLLGGLLVSCKVRAPEKREAKPEAPAPPAPEVVAAPEPAAAPPPAEVPARPPERPPPAPALSMLRADGARIVDTNGTPVILRGCNLGSWHLLEMWMLNVKDVRDQYGFEAILAERFGEEEKNRLMELYRQNWITPRDFQIIRSFNFNVVRLPFNYRLLEDDARPFHLKENAFRWLDAAVDMAGRAGLYVILDLHGAPGGQSPDHTTGRAEQNRLWPSPANRERTARLWKQIADHFKDNPVVAAYDVLNEPNSGDKAGKPELEVFDLVYRAIRSVDQNHLVFAPANRHTFEFYGAPAQRGWMNVGMTEHFYPGLFGDEPTRETHDLFIARALPGREALLKRWQVPYLVGEFNVVFRKVGGAALMRKYYDLYAERGWAATMWSYKLVTESGGLHEDSWCMVKNRDPAPPFSPRTSSQPEIEAFFQWLGTMEYSYYENLGAALTMKDAPPLPELGYPMLPAEPPESDKLTAWQATDIGGALPGGQKIYSDASIDIHGGGEDVWSNGDQFRFVWKKVTGDFRLTATLRGLIETHPYAKAGLMLRSSLDPDSAHVLLNIFPGGEILLASRSDKGANTEQTSIAYARLPVRLRLERKGKTVTAGFSADGKTWSNTPVRVSTSLGSAGYAGMAVLSHDNRVLTTGSFEDIKLSTGIIPR
ncbi:MAG: cellulase family glycosylhydrolase [Verrucomicrobiota bacterium]